MMIESFAACSAFLPEATAKEGCHKSSSLLFQGLSFPFLHVWQEAGTLLSLFLSLFLPLEDSKEWVTCPFLL